MEIIARFGGIVKSIFIAILAINENRLQVVNSIMFTFTRAASPYPVEPTRQARCGPGPSAPRSDTEPDR